MSKEVKGVKKKKNKLAIVIAASDGLELTCQCIRSARSATKTDHEIIVVDNNSSDGTSEWLTSQADVKVIQTDKLETYSNAINMGLRAASKDCNYLSVLNNDLIFTEGWDVRLIESIEHPEWLIGVDRVGIAGPMSNHVAGKQLLKSGKYNLPMLNQFAAQLDYEVKKDMEYPPVLRAGFLSGFCWIMTRECYESVGELDDLNDYKVNDTEMPLGFEDNDYVHRAELAGFASVICRYAFVHHFGGQTTMRLKQDFAQRGMKNRFPFYNKWKGRNRIDSAKFKETGNDGTCDIKFDKKLVAGYRVKNVGKWFKRVLAKMSEVADEIVVFNDNSDDDTVAIAESFEKVVKIHNQTESGFNEARDREKLFQLCKERNPDWIIITDGDEELEEKFDRAWAEKLMNPIKPNVYGYIFRYMTFWDSEKYHRKDGIFGGMANVRMVRNMPNQHIVSDHPQGFHCNSVPWIPEENRVFVPLRIKHYGYLDRADRLRKYEWYQKMDTDKRELTIGAENYDHLVDINVSLLEYRPNISIGVAMIVRDEEEQLEKFLDAYHMLFDEFVVVDTGSKDNTKEVAKFYGAKVYDFKWCDDFSKARQFAKDKLTTTWCFQLDPDETLGEVVAARFYRMVEESVLGYVFPIVNHLPSGKAFVSENGRLFRNLPEVCYANPVHESVNDSLSKIKGHGKVVFVANMREALHHFGYLKDPLAVEKKLRKYAAICKKKLARDPNDGMAHFSLALHCLNEGDEDQCEYHFKQAMIHSPKLTQSHQQLAHLYLRKAKVCLEDAVNGTNPMHPVHHASMRILDAINPFADELEIVGLPSVNID